MRSYGRLDVRIFDQRRGKVNGVKGGCIEHHFHL